MNFSNNDLTGKPKANDDALVVRAVINNYEVDRILVTSGSDVNVMFFDLPERIGLNSQDFRPSRGPLVGCFGEKEYPEGEVTVPVTWGDVQYYATFHVNFVVVRAQSKYNCFFGRPLLHQFGAVASTYHMMVKFPTPSGVAQVRADLNQPPQGHFISAVRQIISEECSNIASGSAVDKVTTKGGGMDRTFQTNNQLQDPFAEANADDAGAGSKQNVHFRVQQRDGRKSLTTVQGLKKEHSKTKLLKDPKKEQNGTVVENPDLGQDRATGQDSEPANERHIRLERERYEVNIDDQDPLNSVEKETSAEHYEGSMGMQGDETTTTEKAYSKRKSKAEGFKEEFQMLKSGMDAVASAISRCAPRMVITEEQLYEEVLKIDGLTELSQIIAYDFLCGDANRGRAFIGLPLTRKKLWLEFKLGHPLE